MMILKRKTPNQVSKKDDIGLHLIDSSNREDYRPYPVIIRVLTVIGTVFWAYKIAVHIGLIG